MWAEEAIAPQIAGDWFATNTETTPYLFVIPQGLSPVCPPKCRYCGRFKQTPNLKTCDGCGALK
jgi:hypothetical protein